MLAKELGTTTAHMANMVNRKSGPGDEMLAALAAHWGMTRDQLEAAAMGEAIVPAPDTGARIRASVKLMLDGGKRASRNAGTPRSRDAG